MKHPSNKFERRSIEAKALELKQFRQKKINAKKRKILVDLQEQETEDDIKAARLGDRDQLGEY